jgi:hypothetical protein
MLDLSDNPSSVSHAKGTHTVPGIRTPFHDAQRKDAIAQSQIADASGMQSVGNGIDFHPQIPIEKRAINFPVFPNVLSIARDSGADESGEKLFDVGVLADDFQVSNDSTARTFHPPQSQVIDVTPPRVEAPQVVSPPPPPAEDEVDNSSMKESDIVPIAVTAKQKPSTSSDSVEISAVPLRPIHAADQPKGMVAPTPETHPFLDEFIEQDVPIRINGVVNKETEQIQNSPIVEQESRVVFHAVHVPIVDEDGQTNIGAMNLETSSQIENVSNDEDEAVPQALQAQEITQAVQDPEESQVSESRQDLHDIASTQPEYFDEEHNPTVEEQVAGAMEDIVKLKKNRDQLEQSTAQLIHSKAEVMEKFLPLEKQRSRLQSIIKEIEQREHSALTAEEQRDDEMERWEKVQQLYQTEQGYFDTREEVEKITNELHKAEQQYNELTKEEELLIKRINSLKHEGERRQLELALQKLTEDVASKASILQNIQQERTNAESLLKQIVESEKLKEQKSGELESKGEQAGSAAQLKQISTERYRLESERHQIEESRWGEEEKLKQLGTQIFTLEDSLKQVAAKKQEIEAKLRALENGVA